MAPHEGQQGGGRCLRWLHRSGQRRGNGGRAKLTFPGKQLVLTVLKPGLRHFSPFLKNPRRNFRRHAIHFEGDRLGMMFAKGAAVCEETELAFQQGKHVSEARRRRGAAQKLRNAFFFIIKINQKPTKQQNTQKYKPIIFCSFQASLVSAFFGWGG